MKSILLVFPLQKAALAESLTLELEDAFYGKGEAAVTIIKNEKRAMIHLQAQQHDLVIININIPENEHAPIDETAHRGFHLAEWMRNNQMMRNIILITPSLNNENSLRANELDNCLLLAESDSLTKDVVRHATTAKDPDKYVELVFDLSQDIHRWQYQINLTPQNKHIDQGHITVSNDFIEDLIDLSKEMSNPDYKVWAQKLNRVGEKLKERLFHVNGEFGIKIYHQLTEAGGLQNSRVRFVVSKEMHPIMLEAIIPPELSDYWMLQAPLYRRVNADNSLGQQQCTLFQDTQRAPINCLIIRSDISGPVDELKFEEEPLVLEKLENVPTECDQLVEFLKLKKADFNIGEICQLGAPQDEPATVANVKKTLKDKKWHLIHYAGHSYYDAKTDTGYLFFPDESGLGTPEKIEIPEFSDYARQTQFVYLSSCRSTDVQFAFSLANNQIPGVLGYRWDIEDNLAMNHADSFYKHLFEEKSVEKAFLKTRQDMYKQHEKARIWAAPMLILQ